MGSNELNSFGKAYNDLKRKMIRLSEMDGDVFVPNIDPPGKVDYLFIGMEPSLGGWSKDELDASAKVNRGFRNFLDGYETMILHYSIRKYLLKKNERYYITDFSKGAMFVELAKSNRKNRYARWYTLLNEEIQLLVKPSTRIYAVGSKVEDGLRQNKFTKPFTRILHYSTNAAALRSIPGKEKEFESFSSQVSHEDFLEIASLVLDESSIPEEFSKRSYDKMARSSLTISRKKLMFNYQNTFTFERT
jgi:hypothetical protein